MTSVLQNERPVNVIITRSREGNEELAGRLRLAGLNPIAVEAFSIAPPRNWSPVDRLLKRIGSFDWLVFTSASGVKYFGIRAKALSLRFRRNGRPRFAAVGRRTADALLGLGIEPEFVPTSYTTKALAEELPAEPGSKLLLLRADIADHNLTRRLVERRYDVEEAATYRTKLGKGPAPKIGQADLLIFASPSAVRGFCSLLSRDELARAKRLKTVCIGPVTESAARENGFRDTTRPHSYTLDAVVREVVRLGSHDR